MYFKIRTEKKSDKIILEIEGKEHILSIANALALKVELFKAIGIAKDNQK
ncbi:MAG: hypothetical protein Q7T55_23115 [Solirubrobacteraceae bacterium]|nr:hypothetical protein [Solirubrobacteraceae bacterium]